MKGIDIKEDLPYWGEDKPEKSTHSKKKFISVYWKCCHCFSRLYKNKAGNAYEGTCPSCGARCSAPVGPGGTSRRLFFAG